MSRIQFKYIHTLKKNDEKVEGGSKVKMVMWLGGRDRIEEREKSKKRKQI